MAAARGTQELVRCLSPAPYEVNWRNSVTVTVAVCATNFHPRERLPCSRKYALSKSDGLLRETNPLLMYVSPGGLVSK